MNSNMKKYILTDINKKKLLVQSKLFQPDDTIDPESFHFDRTASLQSDYLEEQENLASLASTQCVKLKME